MADEFEIVEIEYTDDDILYYLVDEDDVEVGFVIEEDGEEVECYYEEYDGLEFEIVDDTALAQPQESVGTEDDLDEEEEHGYLYKIATIAGHEGNKARKIAEKKLNVVRDKATVQAKKASKAASAKAKEAKNKADEIGLGLTRDDVSEMTSDLNELAKEGAATAKELKETYDDIMDSIGFLIPKKGRRR